MARTKRTPAAIRFNNSGAQYPGPISRRFGSPGHSVIGGGHLIARFETPEQGAAAHFALLGSSRYIGRTLEGVIKKWSGGNSNSAYTKFVARASGLRPTDKLTRDVLAGPQGLALVRAMSQWEAGGQRYPLDDAGWARAQPAGLGTGEALERLRLASTQQRAPTTEAPQSEATRRMMASADQPQQEPWQRISPLPASGPQAPQMGVVDPMNPGDEPVETPRTAPEAGSIGRAGLAAGTAPSWAQEAFARSGNEPISPVAPIPSAPPSSRLLLGDNGLAPMWSRNAPPMRSLMMSLFGS